MLKAIPKDALKRAKILIFIKFILKLVVIFTKCKICVVFFCYSGRGGRTYADATDKVREWALGKC